MSSEKNVSGKENRLEVLNVLHQYAWSFDSNDMTTMASLFSEQAMTAGTVTGTDISWGPWNGVANIVSNLGAIRKSQSDKRRHMLTTPIFLSLSGSEATVKLYLALFATAPGGEPALVTTGEYSANLSKVSGLWKIDSLEAVLDSAF